MFLFAVPAIAIGLQARSSIWKSPAPGHDDHSNEIQGRDDRRRNHNRREIGAKGSIYVSGTMIITHFKQTEGNRKSELRPAPHSSPLELDPSATPILADKGLILFYADRKEKAITLLKQIEATDPEFLSSHHYLGNIVLANKDYSKNVSEARHTAELSHDAGARAVADAAQKGLQSGGEQVMYESILQVQKKLYAHGAVQATR